jgi:copper(I)-binding protein
MNLNRSIVAFICLFLFSACTVAGNSPSIEITDAWVRTVDHGMNDMGGSATALFLNIQNNSSTADTLLMVKSDVAEMVQIHLSEVDANGIASMHEVTGVELPAHGVAELKPGGYHVMLMGLKQEIKEGDLIEFTLVFQNAGEMTIEAVVRTP